MTGQRVDEITIDDLEKLIAARRAARVRGEEMGPTSAAKRRRFFRRWSNRMLTFIEVAIVVVLVYSIIDWVRTRDTINQASVANLARALPTPSTVPAIAFNFLPGGHTPPTSPGGAMPIEASIPQHLRPLVEASTPALLPTVQPQPEQPIRITIHSIGVDAPIVQGDDWDSLKLGVGHHVGSANPGEHSNMVLSAHNDIFGEIFRKLPDMQLGDEIIIETAKTTYRYLVKAKRIIEPTQVEVMDPTRKPIVTLISCYPYLVDTQRIVVIGELVDDSG